MAGDIVRLAPGERVAVDGVITEGHGWINESIRTGEPAPVEKSAGAPRDPLVADIGIAAAMALSSVFVVTNALRLRRAGPWRRGDA